MQPGPAIAVYEPADADAGAAGVDEGEAVPPPGPEAGSVPGRVARVVGRADAVARSRDGLGAGFGELDGGEPPLKLDGS